MYGAILGDMVGAPYEFDRSPKTMEFSLFGRGTQFTDDSVMSIAVAEALMDSMGKSDKDVKGAVIASMQKWGRKYPNAGYGGMFRGWLRECDPKPYGSFGNGSAMRVSAAGWLYDSMAIASLMILQHTFMSNVHRHIVGRIVRRRSSLSFFLVNPDALSTF